ncbi:MAG: bifunctional heptose 7-phosphate kinase/heptose 1-phosphate adenyltransferase, partial [Myxococcaceae bacterium]
MPQSATPRLLQLTDSFPARRVLVVGDLVADHYIYGRTERISREAPVLIVRYEDSEVKLGGGANAAANVRSLGGRCTAVGAIGHDAMGLALTGCFEGAGIELRAVRSKQVETETKTRILAGGVNTTRQQMIRLDRGARGLLPEKVRKDLARELLKAARNADAVLVSDYGAGAVDGEVREGLRRLAADGLTVCVDSRYGLRAFRGVTVAKPNEPELEALTG